MRLRAGVAVLVAMTALGACSSGSNTVTKPTAPTATALAQRLKKAGLCKEPVTNAAAQKAECAPGAFDSRIIISALPTAALLQDQLHQEAAANCSLSTAEGVGGPPVTFFAGGPPVQVLVDTPTYVLGRTWSIKGANMANDQVAALLHGRVAGGKPCPAK